MPRTRTTVQIERFKDAVKTLHACQFTLREAVSAFRSEYIAIALEANRGNVSRTARELGSHRNTLARYAAKLRAAGHPVTTRRRPMKVRAQATMQHMVDPQSAA